MKYYYLMLFVGFFLGIGVSVMLTPSSFINSPNNENKNIHSKPNSNECNEIANNDIESETLDAGEIVKNDEFYNLFKLADDFYGDSKVDKLEEVISSFSFASADEVKRYKDPISFAFRYSQAISENLYEKEYLNGDGEFVDSWFTSGEPFGPPESNFPSDTKKIFLNMVFNHDVNRDVLVKWYRVDDGKRILLKRFSLNADIEKEFFWVSKDKWENGVYNVEIFSADESLKLISASQYIIY